MQNPYPFLWSENFFALFKGDVEWYIIRYYPFVFFMFEVETRSMQFWRCRLTAPLNHQWNMTPLEAAQKLEYTTKALLT